MAKGARGGKRGKSGGGGSVSAFSQSELKLADNIPDDEKKDIYYQISLSAGDKADMNSTNANTINFVKNQIKYNTVLVNESMPTLTGSVKQVAWAESIRNKAVNNPINSIVSRLPVINYDYSKRDAFIKQASQYFNTPISSFSDAVNKFLAGDKNGAFHFFKNATSAKAIIDSKYN